MSEHDPPLVALTESFIDVWAHLGLPAAAPLQAVGFQKKTVRAITIPDGLFSVRSCWM